MNNGRGKHDITLDGGDIKMGFTLAREPGRPAVVPVEMDPGRLDELVRHADVPRIYDNLDAGMGFSRRLADVPNGYSHCRPGYTRASGGIFCPPGKLTEITLPAAGTWEPASIIESEYFDGSIYLLTAGRHVLEMPLGASTATVSYDLGAGVIGTGMAVFNNKLYVSSSGGLANRDATTNAWSAKAPVYRVRMKAVNWRPLGIPTDVLLGVSGEANLSSVRWCPITADPMVDDNWSAALPVGIDRSFPITTLVAAPRHVYMLRPDGVWDMDELGARAFNIAPWMAANPDTAVWGAHTGSGLYVGHNAGLAFIPTSGEAQYEPIWVHPGAHLPYEGPIRGNVLAGCLHAGWRMVGLYDGIGTTYVCAGMPSTSAYGAATHVWHGAEAEVPGLSQHMKVYSDAPTLYNAWPRLLVCTTTTGAPPTVRAFWYSLSKLGSPILEMIHGGKWEPAPFASLMLPADAWDQPSAMTTLLQVDMVTERVTQSDTLRVWAAADDGAWQDQGAASGDNYTSLAPIDPVGGRFVRARIDTTGCPILRSIDLRAAVSIELREARVYRVILAYDDGMRTVGARETRDPERRMADLQWMLGRIVILEDGVSMRVRVLQVMAGERRQLGGASRDGAWAIVVPILVSILDRPFRWDGPARDRYDAERVWV